MKRVISIFSIMMLACIAFTQNKTVKNFSSKPLLEVYYFHITNRCPTCISIEANTKKTLETYFSKEVKDGKIKLIILNVDDEKNKAISEKYAAFGSALFLTKKVSGKETTTDMTNFAFQNSRNRPEKFIEGLKDKINENLKK